jgi:hypothetical protein
VQVIAPTWSHAFQLGVAGAVMINDSEPAAARRPVAGAGPVITLESARESA